MRSFWAEYSACMGFAYLNLLLPMNAWFDFSSGRSDFEKSSYAMAQIVGLALTSYHIYKILPEALRTFRLARRNIEYTDEEYCWAFKRWKKQEMEMSKEASSLTEEINKVVQQMAEKLVKENK